MCGLFATSLFCLIALRDCSSTLLTSFSSLYVEFFVIEFVFLRVPAFLFYLLLTFPWIPLMIFSWAVIFGLRSLINVSSLWCSWLLGMQWFLFFQAFLIFVLLFFSWALFFVRECGSRPLALRCSSRISKTFVNTWWKSLAGYCTRYAAWIVELLLERNTSKFHTASSKTDISFACCAEQLRY